MLDLDEMILNIPAKYKQINPILIELKNRKNIKKVVPNIRDHFALTMNQKPNL